MKHIHLYWDDLKTRIKATVFSTEDSVSEIHSILQITDTRLDAKVQFLNIQTAIQRIALSNVFDRANLIWKRFFVSDVANQFSYINDDSNTISSIVQQPPLNGTKVAVWLYFTSGDSSIKKEGNTLAVQRHGGHIHLYTTQLNIPLKNEYAETQYIFNSYIDILHQYQSSLKENCIRTWIFVQGVDIHYKDMVKARVACFDNERLNKETHYIASTGSEGR